MNEHHRIMFEYDKWANNQVIDVMVNHDMIDDRVWSLMSHIIWAKGLWMQRIRLIPPAAYTAFDIIPMQELKSQGEKNHTDFISFIASVTDWGTVVQYTDSQGNPYKSTYEEILTHIANHGTYHRGQINSRLKELGVQPPRIDHILFTRAPRV